MRFCCLTPIRITSIIACVGPHSAAARLPIRSVQAGIISGGIQAVELELLGVLTAAADRAGCNKSLLVVGPCGAGKTLVRNWRLDCLGVRQLRIYAIMRMDPCQAATFRTQRAVVDAGCHAARRCD